jgi:hypothetical protein
MALLWPHVSAISVASTRSVPSRHEVAQRYVAHTGWTVYDSIYTGAEVRSTYMLEV